MVHACESVNEAERDVAIRRASGFNQLFEAALNKETDSSSLVEGNSKGSGSRQKSKGKEKKRKVDPEDVRLRALEDLERWQSLPANKWTWGIGLTLPDLQAMVRAADRNYELPHSGYDDSLPTGRMSGYDSPTQNPAILNDDLSFLELSSDIGEVRELDLDEIPLAFSMPCLHFLGRVPLSSNVVPDRSPSLLKGKQREITHLSVSAEAAAETIFPWLQLPPPSYVKAPVTASTTSPVLISGDDEGTNSQLPPRLQTGLGIIFGSNDQAAGFNAMQLESDFLPLTDVNLASLPIPLPELEMDCDYLHDDAAPAAESVPLTSFQSPSLEDEYANPFGSSNILPIPLPQSDDEFAHDDSRDRALLSPVPMPDADDDDDAESPAATAAHRASPLLLPELDDDSDVEMYEPSKHNILYQSKTY
jgi:hypothetical protein